MNDGKTAVKSISVEFLPDEERVSALVPAVNKARKAQEIWAGTRIEERLRRLRRLRFLLAQNASRLAAVSAFARGCPESEVLASEVLPLIEAARFLEKSAKRILAPCKLGSRQRPFWLAGIGSQIHREPCGVVLIIGPSNYPLLIPAIQMMQALVAGNTVLLKPGDRGRSVAKPFCDLMACAGFSASLVTLLSESADSARAAIAARPDKVVFTGSAATGRLIQKQLAPFLIPSTMELSGCDPSIVLHDADLGLTTRALTFGLRLNGGRTCVAPRRVFVVRNVASDLEGRLSESVEKLISSNEAQITLAESARCHIRSAIENGAHFVAGDESRLPAVLAGVPASASILQEDLFAPVLSLVTVADEEEAIRLSNNSPYALGASIFTRDENAGRMIASRLNAGIVTVNDLIIPGADPRLPFGGRAHSGFGVTRGEEGLLDLTVPKVVTVTRSAFRPAFDAPQEGDERLIQAYIKMAHGGGFKTRWNSLLALVRELARRSRKRKWN